MTSKGTSVGFSFKRYLREASHRLRAVTVVLSGPSVKRGEEIRGNAHVHWRCIDPRTAARFFGAIN